MKERMSTWLLPNIRHYARRFATLWHNNLTKLSRYHRYGLAIAVLILVIGILLPSPPPPSDITLRHVDPPASFSESAITNNNPQSETLGRWHSFHVAAGETLAQLFRDNNLPTEAIFAMANVEGDGKPLSTLSAGQLVKIRLTASRQVTGLTLDTVRGPVLFTRQVDGSFIRVQ